MYVIGSKFKLVLAIHYRMFYSAILCFCGIHSLVVEQTPAEFGWLNSLTLESRWKEDRWKPTGRACRL